MKRVLAVALAVLLLGIASIPTGVASAQEKQREAEGWHLIESLYMVPDEDLDVNGGPRESWMTGVVNGLLLDYWQDTGSQGDIILKHYRTDKGGTVFTSVEWEILWENPPAYLPGGQPASITVEHRVLEAKTWEPPRMSAIFDVPDMEIGYRSSSPNTLHKPGENHNPYRDTTAEAYGERAIMTTERPIAAGDEGDRMALYIAFGDGYGMRYTYRWGVQELASALSNEDALDSVGE
jgi:hypothetical protein